MRGDGLSVRPPRHMKRDALIFKLLHTAEVIDRDDPEKSIFYAEMSAAQLSCRSNEVEVLAVLVHREVAQYEGQRVVVKFSKRPCDAEIHRALFSSPNTRQCVIPLVDNFGPFRILDVYGHTTLRKCAFKVMEDWSDAFLGGSGSSDSDKSQLKQKARQIEAAVPALRHCVDWRCARKNAVVHNGACYFFDFEDVY